MTQGKKSGGVGQLSGPAHIFRGNGPEHIYHFSDGGDS